MENFSVWSVCLQRAHKKSFCFHPGFMKVSQRSKAMGWYLCKGNIRIYLCNLHYLYVLDPVLSEGLRVGTWWTVGYWGTGQSVSKAPHLSPVLLTSSTDLLPGVCPAPWVAQHWRCRRHSTPCHLRPCLQCHSWLWENFLFFDVGPYSQSLDLCVHFLATKL